MLIANLCGHLMLPQIGSELSWGCGVRIRCALGRDRCTAGVGAHQMRTSDLQPAQFRRRPATSNAAFSVLFAVCVRNSGRFDLSDLAACGFCPRTDTP